MSDLEKYLKKLEPLPLKKALFEFFKVVLLAQTCIFLFIIFSYKPSLPPIYYPILFFFMTVILFSITSLGFMAGKFTTDKVEQQALADLRILLKDENYLPVKVTLQKKNFFENIHSLSKRALSPRRALTSEGQTINVACAIDGAEEIKAFVYHVPTSGIFQKISYAIPEELFKQAS